LSATELLRTESSTFQRCIDYVDIAIESVTRLDILRQI